MDENRAVVTAEGKVAETTAAQSVENVKVGPGHPDYIPTKEKWMYGIGALMDGGGVALMSCVMLNYMTSLGIAAAVVQEAARRADDDMGMAVQLLQLVFNRLAADEAEDVDT